MPEIPLPPLEALTAEVTTEDSLLNGRLGLRQTTKGFRVAIDSVFLAAAVPATAGDRVLELGTGVGAAALCLAHRVPGCQIVGLERQPDIARLAADNAVLNRLEDRIKIVVSDVCRTTGLRPASFDHVMANPPHLDPKRGLPSPDQYRQAAKFEMAGGLSVWVDQCVNLVRPRGGITLIHRADRLDELIACLGGRTGGTVVFPLWPNGVAHVPAKRILVYTRRGVNARMSLAQGLTMHRSDGQFTTEAQAVLRDGQALVL